MKSLEVRPTFAVFVAMAVATGLVVGACSDDEAPSSAAASVDDAGPLPDAPYTGPTRGGMIPPGPSDPDAGPPVYDIDGDVPCCVVAFVLPDPTGDESSARVEGTVAGLDDGGLPMSWSDGAWRASACLPAGEAMNYRFRITSTPDAGPDADTDAGVVVDYRTNTDVPTFSDANDDSWNQTVIACGDGGA